VISAGEKENMGNVSEEGGGTHFKTLLLCPLRTHSPTAINAASAIHNKSYTSLNGIVVVASKA